MLEQKLDQLILSFINQHYFPGLVIRIVRDQRLVLSKAYGKASKIPIPSMMTTRTRFDLASLTKVVMSTIILRLITEDKLQLEQPIVDCLPRLKQRTAFINYFSQVTLQHLLTHASGLPAWHPFYATQEDFYVQLERMVTTEPPTEPGTYSDLNFMLIGEIVREITGTTLGQAVERYIREPLGLPTLSYGPLTERVASAREGGVVGDVPAAPETLEAPKPPEEPKPPEAPEALVAATGFGNATEVQLCQKRGLSFTSWRSATDPMWGEVNDGNAYHFWLGEAGHAGLFGTSEDVSKLGELYLNRGHWQGEQLIHEELVQLSMTPHVGIRGLGWEFSSIYPKGCGHTGFTGTCLWLLPEYKLVVTTLTNRLHTPEPQNIQPFRKACHQLIYETIGEI